MYAARATSALCRLYFPEVLAGLGYIPDEIGIEIEPEALLSEADIVVDESDIDLTEAVDEAVETLDAEVVTDG